MITNKKWIDFQKEDYLFDYVIEIGYVICADYVILIDYVTWIDHEISFDYEIYVDCVICDVIYYEFDAHDDFLFLNFVYSFMWPLSTENNCSMPMKWYLYSKQTGEKKNVSINDDRKKTFPVMIHNYAKQIYIVKKYLNILFLSALQNRDVSKKCDPISGVWRFHFRNLLVNFN